MSEPFPVSGNIDPASFPHMLVHLHRRGATGSLKVVGPTHPKALYFRAGRVLFGSSNDPKDQLGSILLESGKITRQQLDEVSAKVGPGRPLAKVLSESGFVNQRELGDAARVKVERILADVLSWSVGSFEFEDGVLPKGAVDLKLSTEKLLLAAVQRIGDRAFALRHVGLDTVLEPSPEGEPALAEIRSEVWPLLERLDGRRALRDGIALTRLDEFEATKTACALLFLGVVKEKEEQTELDLAEEAQRGFAVPEEEMAMTMRVPLSDSEPAPFAFAQPEPEPETGRQSTGFAFQEETLPASQPSPFVQAEPEASPVEEDEEPLVVADTSHDLPPDAPTYILPPTPQPAARPVAQVSRPAPVIPPVVPAPSRPPVATPPPRDEDEESSESRREPALPDLQAPTVSARPSREDLAALDALLNRPSIQAGPDQSAATRWEPRLETSPAASSDRWPPAPRSGGAALRRTSARVEPSSRVSRLPLLFAAITGVTLTTFAAWYFLLRTPRPVPPEQRSTATSTASRPAPPTTLAPASASSSNPEPALTPSAAAPTAAPAVSPRPTPPTARLATQAEARELLASGDLPRAARAYAAWLSAAHRSQHTLQVLTACSAETVQKAAAATGSPGELFILPVELQGRSCFRVCWGLYDTPQAADPASVPAYFRQGGGRPRVSRVAELLS